MNVIAKSSWAVRLSGAVLATAMLCVVTAKPVEAASADAPTPMEEGGTQTRSSSSR